MLKKAPNFVLTTHCTKLGNGYPSNPSTYTKSTPQGPRSLRPRWMAFLSILHVDVSLFAVVFRLSQCVSVRSYDRQVAESNPFSSS